jgi:uncharacterized protein YcbX
VLVPVDFDRLGGSFVSWITATRSVGDAHNLRMSEASMGQVGAVRRYPVKSMLGEELECATVTEGGLAGDRAFALVDESDGKVATAKNPKKWPGMFGFEASYGPAGPVARENLSIRLPDGRVVNGADPQVDGLMSEVVGREVTLQGAGAHKPGESRKAEGLWLEIDGMPRREPIVEFTLPPGTFFDGAVIHLVTTSTLAHMTAAYPAGCFDPRRFRPNLVIKTGEDQTWCVENDWVGGTLAIGDRVRLRIVKTTGRCIMTTLPFADLPGDLGILKTVAAENQAKVGVYGTVVAPGIVAKGDAVRLLPGGGAGGFGQVSRPRQGPDSIGHQS